MLAVSFCPLNGNLDVPACPDIAPLNARSFKTVL
jgi:hypothetical protein